MSSYRIEFIVDSDSLSSATALAFSFVDKHGDIRAGGVSRLSVEAVDD